MHLLILCLLFLSSCIHTRSNMDASLGPNPGFEILKDGLPVNWIFYDPPDIQYRILSDSLKPAEGKLSLHFSIDKSSEDGDKHHAGFTGELPELSSIPGKYQISFWVKNQGTRFRVFAEGVKETTSSGKPAVLEQGDYIPDWKKISLNVEIPADMWLRFEVQLKGTGDFYIDGLDIRKI